MTKEFDRQTGKRNYRKSSGKSPTKQRRYIYIDGRKGSTFTCTANFVNIWELWNKTIGPICSNSTFSLIWFWFTMVYIIYLHETLILAIVFLPLVSLDSASNTRSHQLLLWRLRGLVPAGGFGLCFCHHNWRAAAVERPTLGLCCNLKSLDSTAAGLFW